MVEPVAIAVSIVVDCKRWRQLLIQLFAVRHRSRLFCPHVPAQYYYCDNDYDCYDDCIFLAPVSLMKVNNQVFELDDDDH